MGETITPNTVLRNCATSVADAIRADEMIGSYAQQITVIVEDRANIETTIKTAITKATGGVAVLVAVTGFRRRTQSGPLLTGTLDIEISVHENPMFNRKGNFTITAQCVAERLARILHWRAPDGFDHPLLFEDMARVDDNSANIVAMKFRVEQTLNGERP